jgi:hypothetical protein
MRLFLFSMIVLLTGCATQFENPRASIIDARVKACMTATKQTNLLSVEVPATTNFLSNQILIAKIKVSGSAATGALVDVLSLSSRPPVIAFGDNDEIIAATLEVALSKLPPNTVRSESPLCFSGDSQSVASLKKQAETANIRFLEIRD